MLDTAFSWSFLDVRFTGCQELPDGNVVYDSTYSVVGPFFIGGDTLIEGVTYFKIHDSLSSSTGITYSFLHEDITNKTITEYNRYTQEIDTLYDFTVGVGDTLDYIDHLNPIPLVDPPLFDPPIVVSTDTVFLAFRHRPRIGIRVYHDKYNSITGVCPFPFSLGFYDTMYWIEGIGGTLSEMLGTAIQTTFGNRKPICIDSFSSIIYSNVDSTYTCSRVLIDFPSSIEIVRESNLPSLSIDFKPQSIVVLVDNLIDQNEHATMMHLLSAAGATHQVKELSDAGSVEFELSEPGFYVVCLSSYGSKVACESIVFNPH